MATLSWAVWPQPIENQQYSQSQWLSVAAHLRGRAWLMQAGSAAGAIWPEWAAFARQQGKIAGIICDVSQAGAQDWRRFDGAPALIAWQHDRRATAQHWRRAQQIAAAWRSPWLRIATLAMPRCWRPAGAILGDVALAEVPTAAADPRCRRCAARERCPGPGNAVFRPSALPAAISNQFDVAQAADGRLKVDVGQGRARWRPLPGSASAAQMALALRRGQLYLDQSQDARIGDFAAQLHGLQRHRDGVWRPRTGQPFAAEEQQLLGLLGQLRGTVVDIGAGPVRYVRALQPRMDAGEIDYVAVEPDPAALLASAAQLPAGRFVRGVAEALPLGSACADAVLLLRSFNHLRDVAAALGEVARIAKPGCRVIIVDNVLFGLARSGDQLRRAHAVTTAQTPFEHYRNSSGSQAWRAVQRAFGGRAQLLQLAEVGPETSNQWLLAVAVA